MPSSPISVTPELSRQIQRLATLAKLSPDKSNKEKKAWVALLPTARGLRFSLFEKHRDWHEPAGLPTDFLPELDPGLGYWVDILQWSQILKGFGRKAELQIGYQDGGLILEDSQSREKLDLEVNAYPETTLAAPEHPQAVYRLDLRENPEPTKALHRLGQFVDENPVLPGVLCRSNATGFEWIGGTGNRVARLQFPATNASGRFDMGVFDPSDLERLILALEADPELTLFCETGSWTLHSPRLVARFPFQLRKWPHMGFLEPKGQLEFRTSAKELEAILKALVAPYESEELLAYRMEVSKPDELRFTWAGRNRNALAGEGRLQVDAQDLPVGAAWCIRSDILKSVQKLLKGKTWTWNVVEGQTTVLRVTSEAFTCWFCPLLEDPGSPEKPNTDQPPADAESGAIRAEALL